MGFMYVYQKVWTPNISLFVSMNRVTAGIPSLSQLGKWLKPDMCTPCMMSCVCLFFLKQFDSLAFEVTGNRRRIVDLSQGGLELPCLLTYTGPEEHVCKVKQRIEDE